MHNRTTKTHKKDFYSVMAEYYDTIFSSSGPKFDFIKKHINKNEKTILDMGCATGAVPICLGLENKEVLAVDLDPIMISLAKNRADKTDFSNGIKPVFEIADMTTCRPRKRPDVLLVLGNTLVHLQGKKNIQKYLTETVENINPGKMIIQIINYNRIFEKKIHKLPLIKKDSLTFERSYMFDDECFGSTENIGEIKFCTSITLNASGEKFQDSTWLVPLLTEELTAFLMDAGFNSIRLFGSYKEDEWSPDSFHTIAVAEK